jgi:hypothetical protein
MNFTKWINEARQPSKGTVQHYAGATLRASRSIGEGPLQEVVARAQEFARDVGEAAGEDAIDTQLESSSYGILAVAYIRCKDYDGLNSTRERFEAAGWKSK